MTTMLLCTGCGEIGEPQEDMRLYECGNCGNQWVSDEGNRCPDCNRFAAVVSTNVCQSCDSPMLEAKGDVLSCASCGAFVLEGKDCPVCAPHPYPSWNEYCTARCRVSDKARWLGNTLEQLLKSGKSPLEPVHSPYRQIDRAASRLAHGYLADDGAVVRPALSNRWLERMRTYYSQWCEKKCPPCVQKDT